MHLPPVTTHTQSASSLLVPGASERCALASMCFHFHFPACLPYCVNTCSFVWEICGACWAMGHCSSTTSLCTSFRGIKLNRRQSHTPRSFWPLSPCSAFRFSFSHCAHKRPIFQFVSSCVAMSLCAPVHQPIIRSASKSASQPECPLFPPLSPSQRCFCCFALHPSIMLPISHFHC